MGFIENMFKDLGTSIFFEGGVVIDPMFVVCGVINNNTFEFWNDLTIKRGIAGASGRRGGTSRTKPNFLLYLNKLDVLQMFKMGGN